MSGYGSVSSMSGGKMCMPANQGIDPEVKPAVYGSTIDSSDAIDMSAPTRVYPVPALRGTQNTSAFCSYAC